VADFCYQCTEKFLGVPGERNDFTNVPPPEGVAFRQYVLCEGCGTECIADASGRCHSATCFEHHGAEFIPKDTEVLRELAEDHARVQAEVKAEHEAPVDFIDVLIQEGLESSDQEKCLRVMEAARVQWWTGAITGTEYINRCFWEIARTHGLEAAK
jgi:hypothetical protein